MDKVASSCACKRLVLRRPECALWVDGPYTVRQVRGCSNCTTGCGLDHSSFARLTACGLPQGSKHSSLCRHLYSCLR